MRGIRARGVLPASWSLLLTREGTEELRPAPFPRAACVTPWVIARRSLPLGVVIEKRMLPQETASRFLKYPLAAKEPLLKLCVRFQGA